MDRKLIKRYFRGECSPEEVQQVLEWFSSNRLNPIQEQDLYEFWQEAGTEREDEEFAQHSDGILAAINNKIDRLENGPLKSTIVQKERYSLPRQAGRRKWLMKVAASILLPIGFLWLLMGYLSAGDQAAVKYVTRETLPGVRKTIQLEDGSKIILNGGSKVSYQEHFSGHAREITLNGEAFFEVKYVLPGFKPHPGGCLHLFTTSPKAGFYDEQNGRNE